MRMTPAFGSKAVVNVPFEGYYLMGTYLLTGESRTTYSEAVKPYIEAMLNKRVVVRLHADKVVSWDHRKLGVPSTRPAPSG